MESLELHPDRFFDPDPAIRNVARDLFEAARDLPLVCPHGHVPPALLARDEPFPEPTALILTPDHYLFRMLHSQGVPMENLGIPSRDGTPVATDPRKIWSRFAERYHLFLGTPTRAWLDHSFYHVFDLRVRLDTGSAMYVYDQIDERLQDPDFRPRALFERFNIEILTTTDAAADPLTHHAEIQASGWPGRVVPCFRPDAALRITSPGWIQERERLQTASGVDIDSYAGFIRALEERRQFFKRMGATSTDHAVAEPLTRRMSDADAEELFSRALRGAASQDDQRRFEAHMLMEMARMSVEDGLVMQIHPGSFRDHNPHVHARYGSDMGADIPLRTEYTRNLRDLLSAYGSDPRFRLVVFTLDESTYSRELAPLAGHYPAMRLGPAWWFFDSFDGMLRYRELTTETAGIYNTAGFNDDTRAFLSIPSRHDLARRVDATFLARRVARHQIGKDDAHEMMRALTYDLVSDTYRLDHSTATA